jgi:hypothetical protein
VGANYNIGVSGATLHATSLADVKNGATIVAADADIYAENRNRIFNTAAAFGFGTDSESGENSTSGSASLVMGFYQSNATATVKGNVTTTGDLDVDSKSINEVNLTRSFSHSGGGLTEPGTGTKATIKSTLFGLAREFVLTRVLGNLGATINSVWSEVEEYNIELFALQSTPKNAFSAALAMVTSDNNARASIGNEGWIQVGGSLNVHALAEDPFQISMSSNAGEVLPASDKNFGAAIAYSKAANQANAYIAWNANVDVKNTLDVTSTANITSQVDPLNLALEIAGFGESTQLGAIGAVYGVGAAATSDAGADDDSIGKSAIDEHVAPLASDFLGENAIGTSYIHAGGSGGKTALRRDQSPLRLQLGHRRHRQRRLCEPARQRVVVRARRSGQPERESIRGRIRGYGALCRQPFRAQLGHQCCRSAENRRRRLHGLRLPAKLRHCHDR